MKSVTRKAGFCGFHGLGVYTDIRLVIKQCALERDLSLFDAGDETEVGEKGITLRFVQTNN